MVDIYSRDRRSREEDVLLSDQRRNCIPEFRAEAVKLVTETDRPVAHVAAEIGVRALPLHIGERHVGFGT